MKKFVLAFCMILILALAIAPAASAQDAGCFSLSAEDCAIINSATANSDNITAFNMDFSLNFTASGLEALAMLSPGLPSTASFNVVGSGPLVMVEEAEIPLAMRLDMTVNADLGPSMQLADLQIPFAIVDGYVYFPMNEEIVGIPVSPEDLAELTEAAGAGAVDPNMLLQSADMSAMAGLGEAFAGMEAYVNYVRLPDEDLMGQTAYPFELTFDLGALLNSPEFAQLLEMVGGLAGGIEGMEGMDLSSLMPMLTPIFQGTESKMVITQWVGADDNFIHQFAFNWGLKMDISALMGSPAGSMAPIDANLSFTVSLSDINAELSVAAPEGARQLSQEEADALFNALGGSGGM